MKLIIFYSLLIHFLLLFMIRIEGSKTFSIFKMKLKSKLEPDKCADDNIVAIIHSKPENSRLRNIIRQTWGQNLKRIFVLGKQKDWNKTLKKEHEKHQDLLQFNFIDDYKNMTIKHLSGLW